MMKYYVNQLPVHARVVGIGTIAILALLLIYIVLALTAWFGEHNERIRDLEPRIARLQGYTRSVDALRESAAQVQETLSEVAYPADTDAAGTGTVVQQLLRRQMEAVGLSVTGSQLLAPRTHEGFDEIRVSLDISGPLEALDQVLIDLTAARPVLLVSAVHLSPTRIRRGGSEQVITGSLSVSAMRLQ